MTDISRYTKLLLEHPPKLTPTDLHSAILIIIESLASSNNALEIYVPIASFLSCLRTSGLDLKAEYIAEAAKAVLKYSTVVELNATPNLEDTTTIDIVGTGGDGQNTFNVSTSSAIVAAGIPGIKVCKHGGKASTSNSGAGDLINVLGCDTSKINSRTVPHLWDNNSFIFMLAPSFHGGMKHVALLRSLLKIPSIFNVLGPLLHPVGSIQKRVLGVYSKKLGQEYARAASIIYPQSETYVVWGHVGLDEVSPIGKTTVWHTDPLNSSQITSFEVEPSMFGLEEHSLHECVSMGPEENAKSLRTILEGHYRRGENGVYDYILLNTAMLYCLTMSNQDWKRGVEVAEESIHSGQALKALDHFLADTKAL
ncbi:LADA_0B02960g1_1 [Lachancea dasiensis]|uniref:Anthranilate phosphoribosyltransferase n=1 Tax=Lachancea dasiensis TaxID=1072105 RepID=A0A1G4ISH9_9SACH|nr:LADA_0B02960g1_1 [Lachancea dasiensis]